MSWSFEDHRAVKVGELSVVCGSGDFELVVKELAWLYDGFGGDL